MRRNGGDTGGDTKANVFEAIVLLQYVVYLPGVDPLQIKDRFGVIEEEDHPLR